MLATSRHRAVCIWASAAILLVLALSWPSASPQESQAVADARGYKMKICLWGKVVQLKLPNEITQWWTFLLGWLRPACWKASAMLHSDSAGERIHHFFCMATFGGVLLHQSWIPVPDCFPNVVAVQAGGQPTPAPVLWHVNTWALTFAKVAVQNFCLDKWNFCQHWKLTVSPGQKWCKLEVEWNPSPYLSWTFFSAVCVFPCS